MSFAAARHACGVVFVPRFSRRQRRPNTRYAEQDPPRCAVAARPPRAAVDGHFVSLTPSSPAQGAAAPSSLAREQPCHELAIEEVMQRFLQKHPDAPAEHIREHVQDMVDRMARRPLSGGRGN